MNNSDHDKWAIIALKYLINHIQEFKNGKKYLTYSELAKNINYPAPHSGNLFGRNIGKTLGVMGHLIENIQIENYLEKTPLIQTLVVSSSTKLPSDGLKEFNTSYPLLSNDKKRDFVENEYRNIFRFGNLWLKVIETIDHENSTLIEKNRNFKQYNPWGSEGSPEHRKLRDYIASNPSCMNIEQEVIGVTEYPLRSGDSIDVVFDTDECIYAIEVKSKRSGDDDIIRGVFQVIKYLYVLEAEKIVKGHKKDLQCFLVVESTLNKEATKIKNLLGVTVLENFDTEHQELLQNYS